MISPPTRVSQASGSTAWSAQTTTGLEEDFPTEQQDHSRMHHPFPSKRLTNSPWLPTGIKISTWTFNLLKKLGIFLELSVFRQTPEYLGLYLIYSQFKNSLRITEKLYFTRLEISFNQNFSHQIMPNRFTLV